MEVKSNNLVSSCFLKISNFQISSQFGKLFFVEYLMIKVKSCDNLIKGIISYKSIEGAAPANFKVSLNGQGHLWVLLY